MKKKRVIVGLSGGVDSSVAAYLLTQQDYEVIGLFMKNWHDESVTLSNECPWLEDSNDAMLVAEKLGIPFQTIDLSVEYKERIVDYMFDEYAAGRTPNPDVLCNREIKFDVFLKIAKNIIQKKMKQKWTKKDKGKQLIKRARYAEFNLLHDRGTKFGLSTGGNIEAIFMSLPPLASW